MPSNLRYSAAKTSTVSKIKSPTKKTSPIKKFLPTQTKYRQNLNKSNSQDDPLDSKSNRNTPNTRLTIDDYNVELDYQLSRKHNIVTAIDTILDNMWTESSTIHNKYYSNEDVEAKSMEELLFQIKGLSMNTKAEIMKYRTNQVPHGLVTSNQLYSIYQHEGNTFVDKQIELAIRNNQIRKFVISNASPIIQTVHNKPSKDKITFGFENVEIITNDHQYIATIDRLIDKLELSNQSTQVLLKFKEYIKTNPTTLFLTANDMLTENDLSSLVNFGYLTLTSNYMNEIEHQYALAFPNCGTYLKLINSGRSWLVKTLSKSKFKELLEEDLINRWEGNDINGNSKLTNFRKPFYGFNLQWILADALGAGIIEVFNTPVGRGWKLTGKM